MIPYTCPCCEVSQPPHRDGCTFHDDAADDAADFDEVSTLRAEIDRLRKERKTWCTVDGYPGKFETRPLPPGPEGAG